MISNSSSLRGSAQNEAEAISDRDCPPAGKAGFVALRAPRNPFYEFFP